MYAWMYAAITLAEVQHGVWATFYILQQVLQPLLPLLHSRLRGNLTENISKIYLSTVNEINVFLT